jgi:uncharacterized membrane protein
MSEMKIVFSRASTLVALVLVIQLVLFICIFFNIPVGRQVISFFYLTFIPGFILLKLLKVEKFNAAETIVFSVGLSIALLLIVGLFLDGIGPSLGVTRPLELTPLVVTISGFVLSETAVFWLRSSRVAKSSIELNKKLIVTSLGLSSLPILSVVGASWANATGNTVGLLVALMAILVAFVITISFEKLVSPKLHVILVFAIAIALLFEWSLISQYLQGASDIQLEYYVFTLTQQSGHWIPTLSLTITNIGKRYSMLSVTVLPTIYSNVLNLNGSFVFKIIYPLIFAFVPVALYVIWQEKLGHKVALLSSFFFMSQFTFYEVLPTVARQMIGELFFVLLFAILFSKKLSPRNLSVLFIILGFSLIVSHYALALIFAFLASVILVAGYFTKTAIRNLNLKIMVLFLAIMFSWYTFTASSAVIQYISQDLNGIIGNIGNFLNLSSRGQGVLIGLGLTAVPTPLVMISRYIAYITEFLIVVGFPFLMLRRKRRDIDFEYFAACSACILILIAIILIPGFASTFNVERFYHVLLFFLAPLLAIGCIGLFGVAGKFFRFFSKKKTTFLSLIFMILLLGAYFLFQTGIVYEITGSQSYSLPLSRYRLGSQLFTQFNYATGSEVSSAEWLTQNANDTTLFVYADSSSKAVLVSYGSLYLGRLGDLTNSTLPASGEFIYLGELNVVYGKVQGAPYTYASSPIFWDTSEVSALRGLDLVYSNGYCQTYFNSVP